METLITDKSIIITRMDKEKFVLKMENLLVDLKMVKNMVLESKSFIRAIKNIFLYLKRI